MSSNRLRRILKELSDIEQDPSSQIHVQPRDGTDLSHLRASFPGPPDTPYEGGTYLVDITIPSDYPFRPPSMKFSTLLWHPNISSQTGAICLDTLSTAWSPVLTIKSTLLSLQSLLNSPEPKDPQDAQVAKMLTEHPDEFERVARQWAIKHAGAPAATSWTPKSAPASSSKSAGSGEVKKAERYKGYNQAMVDRFINMGFEIDRVVEAFEFVGIDRNAGIDYELEEAYNGDIIARLLGEP